VLAGGTDWGAYRPVIGWVCSCADDRAAQEVT